MLGTATPKQFGSISRMPCRLAVLYIESFGNPRKFAMTARRVAASMPVLAVEAGRSEAGQRAATSHTAAVATPLVTGEALFAQAGVIVVPGFGGSGRRPDRYDRRGLRRPVPGVP